MQFGFESMGSEQDPTYWLTLTLDPFFDSKAEILSMPQGYSKRAYKHFTPLIEESNPKRNVKP